MTAVAIKYKGTTYKSLSALARAYGIKGPAFRQRLTCGWDIEEALLIPIGGKNSIPAKDHLGNKYPSISDMFKAWGINPSTGANRLDAGWSIKKALTTPALRHPVTDHLGNEYSNKKTMAQVYGLSLAALDYRLSAGWSLEEALTKPISKGLRKS